MPERAETTLGELEGVGVLGWGGRLLVGARRGVGYDCKDIGETAAKMTEEERGPRKTTRQRWRLVVAEGDEAKERFRKKSEMTNSGSSKRWVKSKMRIGLGGWAHAKMENEGRDVRDLKPKSMELILERSVWVSERERERGRDSCPPKG